VSVAAGALLFLGPRPGGAVEVRRLESSAATGPVPGATVRLVLAAPAQAVIRDVAGGPGAPSRLYVDLPPGSRLAPGIVPQAAVRPPVAGLRVGIGDGGVLRLVLALEPGAGYRMARTRGGRVITLALTAPVEVGPPAPMGTARPATAGSPALVARPRIVLDPGHGGHDPGARGFVVEKDVTLAVAQDVAAQLRDRLDADVVLTRRGDTTLTLAERTAIANREEADLFVSIHANSSPGRRLHGVETYYLNNTGDRATVRLAAMENGIDRLAPRQGSTELRYILSDLVQVGKMDESASLATAVHRGLVGHLRAEYGNVGDLGVKQGPFYVLVGAYMPCVLVETSFLNHPVEGRRLAGAAYRRAIAVGLADGIERFLAGQRRARTL